MSTKDKIKELEKRISQLEGNNTVYVDGLYKVTLQDVVKSIAEYLSIDFSRNTASVIATSNKPTETIGGTVIAVCPKCNHTGDVDVSPHVYFDENKLGFRCKKCKHVWEVDK